MPPINHCAEFLSMRGNVRPRCGRGGARRVPVVGAKVMWNCPFCGHAARCGRTTHDAGRDEGGSRRPGCVQECCRAEPRRPAWTLSRCAGRVHRQRGRPCTPAPASYAVARNVCEAERRKSGTRAAARPLWPLPSGRSWKRDGGPGQRATTARRSLSVRRLLVVTDRHSCRRCEGASWPCTLCVPAFDTLWLLQPPNGP